MTMHDVSRAALAREGLSKSSTPAYLRLQFPSNGRTWPTFKDKNKDPKDLRTKKCIVFFGSPLGNLRKLGINKHDSESPNRISPHGLAVI